LAILFPMGGHCLKHVWCSQQFSRILSISMQMFCACHCILCVINYEFYNF
jgi:hypothetical protein